MTLPGGGHPLQRPAAGIGQEVDLGAQSTAGPPQRLPAHRLRRRRRRILVIRPSPLCGRPAPPRPPWRCPVPAAAASASPPGCPWAGRGERPQRADVHEPPWSPPRPSTPIPRPRRNRPAAHPGPLPTFHHLTSGDAASAGSSSFRSTAARLATATRFESATTPRRSPDGDRPSGHPDSASGPAATAPAAPTAHRSSHGDQAQVRITGPEAHDPSDTP